MHGNSYPSRRNDPHQERQKNNRENWLKHSPPHGLPIPDQGNRRGSGDQSRDRASGRALPGTCGLAVLELAGFDAAR